MDAAQALFEDEVIGGDLLLEVAVSLNAKLLTALKTTSLLASYLIFRDSLVVASFQVLDIQCKHEMLFGVCRVARMQPAEQEGRVSVQADKVWLTAEANLPHTSHKLVSAIADEDFEPLASLIER